MSIAVHAFPANISIILWKLDISDWSTNFKGLLFNEKIARVSLNSMYLNTFINTANEILKDYKYTVLMFIHDSI